MKNKNIILILMFMAMIFVACSSVKPSRKDDANGIKGIFVSEDMKIPQGKVVTRKLGDGDIRLYVIKLSLNENSGAFEVPETFPIVESKNGKISHSKILFYAHNDQTVSIFFRKMNLSVTANFWANFLLEPNGFRIGVHTTYAHQVHDGGTLVLFVKNYRPQTGYLLCLSAVNIVVNGEKMNLALELP